MTDVKNPIHRAICLSRAVGSCTLVALALSPSMQSSLQNLEPEQAGHVGTLALCSASFEKCSIELNL
jgi:hypothetical protein